MNRKTEGQIFTSPEVINMILDSVQYFGEHILEKNIIEPSFGKGAFLEEIINRIISEGKAKNKTNEEISTIIENNVFGIEKDKMLYQETIKILNMLLKRKHIPLPTWKNLICDDALLSYHKFLGKMDFCVGNPPYVRIRNINTNYRNVVKNFNFTNGTTDLYITFFEIGIAMLKNHYGKLAYITPNSFFRNVSQQPFRDFLIKNRLLTAIFDFQSSPIFNSGAYTCICVLEKIAQEKQHRIFEYRQYNMFKFIGINVMSYDDLQAYYGKKWNFSTHKEIKFLQDNAAKQKKLKDIAIIRNGISTNNNKVYTNTVWVDEQQTIPYVGKHTDPQQIVYFNNHAIESTILRRAVKVAKCKQQVLNNYIIFPYHATKTHIYAKSNQRKIESDYELYDEKTLQTQFPYAYKYLLENKQLLAERNMEPNTLWFAYARRQGLKLSGYEKIAMGKTVHKKAKQTDAYMLDEDVAVYSDLFITLNAEKFITNKQGKLIFDDIAYHKELQKIHSLLTSSDFLKYCTLVGKNMHGNYHSIDTNAIKNYGI